ncbi:hypothetical protein Tco_1358236 [Tanacetum coccineum]
MKTLTNWQNDWKEHDSNAMAILQNVLGRKWIQRLDHKGRVRERASKAMGMIADMRIYYHSTDSVSVALMFVLESVFVASSDAKQMLGN